jgi:hypothetical protein
LGLYDCFAALGGLLFLGDFDGQCWRLFLFVFGDLRDIH